MNLGEILHQEKQDLTEFWKKAKNLNSSDRLALLQEMAARVYFHRTKSLTRYRKKFNKKYQSMFKEVCFICGANCQHRHHIIPLVNGGLNSKKNRIPLCRNCHMSIHPWMREAARRPSTHESGVANNAGRSYAYQPNINL